MPATTLSGISVLAATYAVGERKVPNEALADLGCDPEWIIKRTGIQQRFQIGPDQATSDLAIAAGRACLESANVSPEEIDLIVVGTMTPDHFTPSVANLVQSALGCRAAAFDVNTACSGFVYSLVTASQFIKTGCSKRALVIGADAMTTVCDPKDVKTYPLFGDGAGAVLLGPAEHSESGSPKEPGILAYELGSDGDQASCLLVPGGGSRQPLSQEVLAERSNYLKMDGRTVFKWAVRLIPEAIQTMLDQSGLQLDDIDLIVPHQANVRIIDAAIESMGIEREKFVVNLDRFGNTSAASVPIALAEAVADGRIQPGKVIMMLGFGAGLTWGSCLFRW